MIDLKVTEILLSGAALGVKEGKLCWMSQAGRPLRLQLDHPKCFSDNLWRILDHNIPHWRIYNIQVASQVPEMILPSSMRTLQCGTRFMMNSSPQAPQFIVSRQVSAPQMLEQVVRCDRSAEGAS